ncbi:hypothetical protein TSOC_005095 [Tetrabaena socialis]|uniref:Cyanobacterial aminoacyl-tRNA synthetase CAAD domain-containing protein n=1 Tax=Tetrabaena socialis TaxID=47790 RepID=A0A2J8A7E3_9CHLO|nr:hypothetical protein TSOC_005095 [Tetrabaena socialis]|eukprot:PNH08393.1 hypothetical protein TSOC_005095 [Tetrabaena socialis]
MALGLCIPFPYPSLELAVGLAYSSWFWWRYVLFAEGRRELRSRVKGLRSRAAETLDGLTERTRDLQPPPASDQSSGREVVERLAARHTQQQGLVVSARSDDGSWVALNEPRRLANERDASEAEGGGGASADGGPEGLTEGYVEGLLQELEDRVRDTAASSPATRNPDEERGDDSGAGAGGRAPTVLALSVWAPEPGAEGTLGREEMEKLAAAHIREAVLPSSMRQPSVAEQAGTGP